MFTGSPTRKHRLLRSFPTFCVSRGKNLVLNVPMLDSRSTKLDSENANIKSNYTILESRIYKFRIGFSILKCQILHFENIDSNLFGKDFKLKLIQIL